MKEKLHVLCHSLGRDEYGITTSKIHNGVDWRNHFCSGGESPDFTLCREMVADGLMTERAPNALTGNMSTFFVTAKGVEFIKDNAPKPPKISRSKQRYERFLEYGDGFDSFIEFCKWDAEPERSWNTK